MIGDKPSFVHSTGQAGLDSRQAISGDDKRPLDLVYQFIEPSS